MVPPQISKYYFMDLAPGRSFVEYAVAQGLHLFRDQLAQPHGRAGDWDLDIYAAAV